MADKSKKIHLSPVLSMHNYCRDLNLEPGKYVCHVQVLSGEVQVTHREYDLFSGVCDYPLEGEPKEQIIHLGESADFSFTVGMRDGQPDAVTVANRHYLHPAEFVVSYKKTA